MSNAFPAPFDRQGRVIISSPNEPYQIDDEGDATGSGELYIQHDPDCNTGCTAIIYVGGANMTPETRGYPLRCGESTPGLGANVAYVMSPDPYATADPRGHTPGTAPVVATWQRTR